MPSIIKTIVKDNGFKKAMGEIAKLSRHPYLLIGIQSDAGVHPDSDFTYANIGATHEFGTKRAGAGNRVFIPARPWLNPTMTEGKKDFEVFQDKLANQMLNGKLTLEDLMDRLGLKIQSAMRAKVSSNIAPPNTIMTIKRKGSTRTLIDTGLLRSKISYLMRFES